MRQLANVCSIFLGLQFALQLICHGQAIASSSPNFVAATIKPTDPNRAETDGTIGFTPFGSFDGTSQSLKALVQFVYGFDYFNVDQRIIGGPRWLGSAKFDIQAKCDEETARAFGKMPLKQQLRMEQNMVQMLLAERFKLRTHHEMRQLRVYALVQAKGGSKLKPNREMPGEDEFGNSDGPPGNWRATGVTMRVLANELSSLPEIGGKIVVDKTGLKGSFDIVLRWTPYLTGSSPDNDNELKSDSSAPSLLTALQEQLGLKLEVTKAAIDVIVVDSAELPSAN